MMHPIIRWMDDRKRMGCVPVDSHSTHALMNRAIFNFFHQSDPFNRQASTPGRIRIESNPRRGHPIMTDTATTTPGAAAAAAPAATLEGRPPITVVLDQASLETVKMKSGQYCLLNCDDHNVRPSLGTGDSDGIDSMVV